MSGRPTYWHRRVLKAAIKAGGEIRTSDAYLTELVRRGWAEQPQYGVGSGAARALITAAGRAVAAGKSA